MAGSWGGGSDSGSLSDDSYQLERHIESPYSAFLCPITNRVMRDPVVIENGTTFERGAIEKWFEECKQKGIRPICPVTKKELRSTDMKTSIALRKAIKEWTARNEVVELDKVSKSLSPGTPENDILQALRYVRYICQKSQSNKHVVHKAELVSSIIDLLKNASGTVRSKALQTLRVLVEGSSSTKEIIAEGDTVRTIVKLLSHGLPKEKQEAVSLLFELSKSETLCEKIGSINGAILILVGMTRSESEDSVTVQKADKTLDNLTKCENNVRQMAKSGRLQPLLTLLLKGPVETKISMAAFLGDLALNQDVKVQVASVVGKPLIDLMKSGDMEAKEASLKALNQISTCEVSGKVLIDAGILPPLVKDLFTVGARQPMRLKEVSATILSNLVNSGCNFDSITLGPSNQTLVSEVVIHNLLHLISNTGPSIECKLLQVLIGLTSSPSTVLKVVAAIKSLGGTVSLVQFIEAPQRDRDLRLACIKLLHKISPHMSLDLADALCGSSGEFISLLKIILENTGGITEEQAEAVGLLAHLPERDLRLTRQMLDEGSFPLIISRIRSITQPERMGNRYRQPYLEGLARVLARVTYVLAEEPEAVALCLEHNVASLFIELLPINGFDDVQIVSAWALENLSRHSKNLSIRPVIPPVSCFASVFTCISNPPVLSGLCPVHQGLCSLRETFCLLDGPGVERLIDLLENPNEEAVEASLAALSTLLEDEVDIAGGVRILYEMDGLKCILDVLVDNRNENLRRRAVWAVERFLRTEQIATHVTTNQRVETALVDAYQYGDSRTKYIAERALKHVDKIPNFSGIFPNMG